MRRGVTAWLVILVDETGGFKDVFFIVVLPESVF
jgi:hypothetical protein